MNPHVLAPWRDLSIILLLLPVMVFVLIPGVIFFYSIRGIRWVKRSIRSPLLTARLWAMRVENGADRASRAAVALPIAVEAIDARVRATARGLADFLRLES